MVLLIIFFSSTSCSSHQTQEDEKPSGARNVGVIHDTENQVQILVPHLDQLPIPAILKAHFQP